MAEEPVTDDEVLLEIYRLLVTIRRVLITLLLVVAVLGATALFESSRNRSEQRARETVDCTVRGTC